MNETLALMLVAALLATGSATKNDTKDAKKEAPKEQAAERYLHQPVAGILWCRATGEEPPEIKGIKEIKLDKPARLSIEDQEKLKKLAEYMRKHDCGVRVEGYADGDGRTKKEQSQARAETVKAYLTTKLSAAERVRAEQVDAVGKGGMHDDKRTTREQKNVALIEF